MRQTLPWIVIGQLVAGAVSAQVGTSAEPLSAERVAAIARARAPIVRIAESQVLEARGRLAGARMPGRENPTIEGVATRDDRFERRTQWELSVPIGIGPGWIGRMGLAGAELERDRHLLEDARRGAVGSALAALYRVLHATRRAELARERLSVAADLHRSALERHRSGQAPRLEALVTETEQIRARSELLAEEQAASRERIGLAAALGLPSGEGLVIADDFDDRSFLVRTLEDDPPPRRADVLAADREVRAAKAARRLARTDLLPGLAFRLNYGHEGGEPLFQPGLAVTVPIFRFGQESRGVARARELRAQAELERIGNAAAAEIEGLEKIHRLATDAVDSLAVQALPRIQESEVMVQESYRAGKIDLPALLVFRRDLLETRREYLDRLLDAALAGIDLAVARGQFQ